MNLNQFLRRVDSLTEKLSKEGIGSKASLEAVLQAGGEEDCRSLRNFWRNGRNTWESRMENWLG